MLWRVRTTMPDRPGSLARLAEQCGRADVNILGLQIFPGVEAVTDELVLRTPSDWGEEEIERLVQRAGGGRVSATVCSEAALVDQCRGPPHVVADRGGVALTLAAGVEHDRGHHRTP